MRFDAPTKKIFTKTAFETSPSLAPCSMSKSSSLKVFSPLIVIKSPSFIVFFSLGPEIANLHGKRKSCLTLLKASDPRSLAKADLPFQLILLRLFSLKEILVIFRTQPIFLLASMFVRL